MNVIAPGTYRVLIHAVRKGVHRHYLHGTTLPDGERVVLPLFNNQVPTLKIALYHQPKGFAGGQVMLKVTLHKTYGNGVSKIIATEPTDVKSDVDLTTPLDYCDF